MKTYDDETALKLIQAAATLASGALTEEQKGSSNAVSAAFNSCLDLVEERYLELRHPKNPSVVGI